MKVALNTINPRIRCNIIEQETATFGNRLRNEKQKHKVQTVPKSNKKIID